MESIVLQDFIFFLKGEGRTEGTIALKDKIGILLKTYAYLILFSFVTYILLAIIIFVFDLKEDINENSGAILIRNKYAYAGVILLVTPIIEEFTFRFFLTKFEKRKFAISVSFLLSYVAYELLSKLLPSIYIGNDIFLYYGYILFSYVLFRILVLIVLNKTILGKLKIIWDGNFRPIFFFFSILFSLFHFKQGLLSNYEWDIRFIQLVPLVLFSLMAGYLRIKLGFKYSLLFHFLYNLPSVLITFSLMYF